MIQTARGFKKPQDADNADLRVFVGENMDLVEQVLDNELHNHSNKSTLDKISESAGKMLVDGTKVASEEYVIEATKRVNGIKVVISLTEPTDEGEVLWVDESE